MRGPRSERMLNRALRVIPGVTQLLSKRPDQFGPRIWPTYYSHARGTQVTDLDGRSYLDMSISGIGANVLGYRHRFVDSQVMKAVRSGNSSSLNCPEEVQLAELLVELHPWSDSVRFARTGGEATAIAIRAARAATGREKVLFCGYHGWHDWYLAANLTGKDTLDGHLLPGLAPSGVPKSLAGTSLPFRYNDIASLEARIAEASGDVAAIILEPVRSVTPNSGFLEQVRGLASRIGAVLIFDEISSGFRYEVGGFHLRTSVSPDIAVFAKAISNGYAMSAVVGRESVMSALSSSFVSSTYWTEKLGPAAALATIETMRREAVFGHLDWLGRQVQDIWNEAANAAGVEVSISGMPAMSYLKFEGPNSLAYQTLLTQELLRSGILAGGRYYANFAQKPRHIDRFRRATNSAFEVLSRVSSDKELGELIFNQPVRPGFGRLN